MEEKATPGEGEGEAKRGGEGVQNNTPIQKPDGRTTERSPLLLTQTRRRRRRRGGGGIAAAAV